MSEGETEVGGFHCEIHQDPLFCEGESSTALCKFSCAPSPLCPVAKSSIAHMKLLCNWTESLARDLWLSELSLVCCNGFCHLVIFSSPLLDLLGTIRECPTRHGVLGRWNGSGGVVHDLPKGK